MIIQAKDFHCYVTCLVYTHCPNRRPHFSFIPNWLDTGKLLLQLFKILLHLYGYVVIMKMN